MSANEDKFVCPDCKKQFNVHHNTYYVDDYAEKVCPACWEDRKVATKRDVKKMLIFRGGDNKNPHGIRVRSGWRDGVIIGLIAVFLVYTYFRLENLDRPSPDVSLAAKLWLENRELKADNEWLRMQNKRHELAWKRLDDYNQDQCEFPPRKFDHYLDFGYAHCKPANKKGVDWNLITKHMWGRALFWHCATREGGAPEDNLPRQQREVMRRDIDGCVLHWTQVLDRGVGKGQTSVPARGLRVDVNWELKTRKP